MQGTEYEFDKPTRADLGSGLRKPWTHTVDYAAGKTAEVWVNESAQATLLEKGKLGFSYWDKATERRAELNSWTFFHVDTLVRVEGEVFDAQRNRTAYWSNYVRNSTLEPITVWSSNSNKPIAKGMYAEIKDQLPAGASHTLVFVVYEPTNDMLFAMPLSYLLKLGVTRSIGAQLDMDAEKVKLFDLGRSACWGFRHVGFEWVEQTGKAYPGKGDLYFTPKFQCGVVRDANMTAMIAQKRQDVSEWYEAAKYVAPQPAETSQAPEDVPPPTQEPPTNRRNDDLPF